jgi:hypothetical protein
VRSVSALPLIVVLGAAGCGGGSESTRPADDRAITEGAPPAPGTVIRGDSSTDLDTTPLSAADYAMYAAIMSGASAMLRTLTPTDREALEFAQKVDAGAAKPTAATDPLLSRARSLQQKDVELARLQGIEERYAQVKARIEAVIGPHARPPAPADSIARENLRYLEPHRATIERLQNALRDPLKIANR